MRFITLLLAAGLAGPAHAQDFGPDGTDIDIRGVIDDEVLALDRTGALFLCLLRPEGALAVMNDCLPVAYVSEAELEARQAEREATLAALEAMRPLMAGTALAMAMQEIGCSLRIADEAAAVDEIARRMAPHLGLAPEAVDDDEVMSLLERLVEDGADLLVDQGRLEIDEAAQSVRLTECG